MGLIFRRGFSFLLCLLSLNLSGFASPAVSKKAGASTAKAPSAASSLLVPEELNSISIPETFSLITDLNTPEVGTLIKNQLPGTTAFWTEESSKTKLLAGIHRINPQELRHLSRNDFLEELEKTSKLYETYYKNKEQSRTTYRVKDLGGVFRLRIMSHYLENGQKTRETRYMYFYRPDYRLNFLFIGPEESVKEITKKMQPSFIQFEKSLKKNFSKPLGLIKDRP